MWSFPLFPDQAATNAQRIDALYLALVGISVFFSALIFLLIFVFAVRYRRGTKVNRRIVRSDYLKLELAWIIIPLLISFGIFFWSAKLYFDNTHVPKDALEVYVVGKQWMWKVQHPRGNREINQLHIPLGRTIKLIMTSQDVIHSFFIPAFRIKMDVLPGRYTTTWFEPTKAGEYHLFCAEYCGTDHSGMHGTVVVMEPLDYERWLEQGGEGGATAMAAQGEQLFQRFGCVACHRGDGRGPALAGLFGSEVPLEDGTATIADRQYIRESLLDPMAKIRKGYPRLMPTYTNQMSEDDVNQLVEYIVSLRGQKTTAARSTE